MFDPYIEKVEGVFAIQFACELLKLVSDSKPEYAPWSAENSANVRFGLIVAYTGMSKLSSHIKINHHKNMPI